MTRRRQFPWSFFFGVSLLSCLFPARTCGAETAGLGTITGTITDESGAPLPYANVLILGTSWGAFSRDDGSFRIQNLPVGTYTVQISMMGYEEQRFDTVPVTRDGATTVNARLKDVPANSLPEVIVVARKIDLDRTASHKAAKISSEVVEQSPFTELKDIIQLQAGVIAQGGELHIRGARSNAILSLVDGVPVRDPLMNQEVSLAALAVENTETILGGLDAQYGNAQAGVINYQTKEGTEAFEGEIYYLTDDYGQPDNTFDNLDKVFLGLGGPTPLRNMTFYISGEGTFSDAYPRSDRRQNHRKILNFISLGDRQSNTVRLQGKLAFRPRTDQKLTFEFLGNRSRSSPYLHVWSRTGYVQTFFDTTTTGDVALRHGRWSPVRVDSTYEYYNAAEHTPTYLEGFNQQKLAWTHTLSQAMFYTVKMTRNSFYADTRVAGKQPWEYSGDLRDNFFNYTERVSDPFFVTTGDYPLASQRETVVYFGKTDLTRRIQNHTIQTGLEATYNNMRYVQVDNPAYSNALGEIGTRTRYHYYNPEGGCYFKDSWQHEGMNLNLGIRYDLFSVGRQIDLNEVRERVKQQISPRIGVAYPITDRDVFSFQYGRFYQIPDRRFIFDNRNLYDGRTRGNPNLSNETTVSYQAGVQHLFNRLVTGQFGVYYKDVFGLVDTEQRAAMGSVGNVVSYVNRAYASARGFEATLSRNFANGFSGEINYTFGVATGVASDPNAQTEQTYAYLPISEQPLDWDIRHVLSVQLVLAQPGSWSTTYVWQFKSGEPYTPYGRNTRELKPEIMNSRRLPPSTSLDIRAEKHYRLWGQQFRIFLTGRNVLDAKNITNLSPENRPLAPGRSDYEYVIYYSETGQGGGAYVGQDRNGDGVGDWVPLNDPRVFGDPRSIRMGLTYNF